MTIKTPLPSKVLPGANNDTERINQLIEVVAELREVVEVIQDELHPQHLDEFHGEGLKALIEKSKIPSLKEQLLEAIEQEKRRYATGEDDYCRGSWTALSDVEVIVNRLIP